MDPDATFKQSIFSRLCTFVNSADNIQITEISRPPAGRIAKAIQTHDEQYARVESASVTGEKKIVGLIFIQFCSSNNSLFFCTDYKK